MPLHVLAAVAIAASAAASTPPATAATPVTPVSGASVPLIHVTERLGVERRTWPVSLGVPFPKGWMAPGAPLRAVAADTPLPTQARSLATWPDGSVRWARVDFQATIGPRATLPVRLERAPAPAPATTLDVRETEKGIQIDSGRLRIAIHPRSGGLVDSIGVDAKTITTGPVRTVMESGGKPARALPPERAGADERGPLRAQVSLRGRYENGFAYVVRLQAFAGQPFVRILHTFVNTADAPVTTIDRIGLELPMKLGKASYSAAFAEGSEYAGRLGGEEVEFVQIDNQGARISGAASKSRLSGWFTAQGGSGAVGVDIPFFWQEYPQGVRISPAGIEHDLRSKAGGSVRIGVGAAKTHEVWLAFGAPEGRGLPPRPAGAVEAHVDPEWIASTGALANAVRPELARGLVSGALAAFRRYVRSIDTERWDDSGQVRCPPPGGERPRIGCYGMLNWGDWNFRKYHDETKGCDAWGNQEYDLTQALALLYAATGDAEVKDYLDAAARHFADVDRIHHLPLNPSWVGMNHPKNPLHFSFELGGVDLGHTWLEGMFSYFFLTGDERAKEAAIGIADYLANRLSSPVRGNPRQFGWPVLALAAAFDATGDTRYRHAALDYARRGMAAHPAGGALKHWKMGILADGLAYAHAASGNAESRAWLSTYAAAVAREKPKDLRFYPAVAYAARLTGKTQWLEVALAAADRIEFGDWGKPFTVGTRTGFRIHGVLGAR